MADQPTALKRQLRSFGDEQIGVIFRKANSPAELPNIFPPLAPSVSVEDGILVERDIAVRLRDDPRVAWFRVAAVNHESIHTHNAFARVEWRRP